MIHCSQCQNEIAGDCVACIAGSIMGDEYSEAYFLCERCGVYTVEIYHARFLDEESVSLRGPVSKEEGDAKLQLIKQCSEPWEKKCRCEAHRAYFGDCLD